MAEYKGFGRYSFAFWEDCTIQVLEDNIDIAVTVTRRKMHGRDCRRELNDRVKKIEESRALGKHKDVCRFLMGVGKNGVPYSQ